RHEVELAKSSLPTAAVLLLEYLPHLVFGHPIRARLQGFQRPSKLRREQVVALEREHLTKLHGCSPQPREPVRQKSGIVARQENARQVLLGTLAQAARLLDHPARRHARSRGSDLQHARKTPVGHLRGSRGLGHAQNYVVVSCIYFSHLPAASRPRRTIGPCRSSC